MRSPWLIAATIVAIAIAGYAIFTVGRSSDRASPASSRADERPDHARSHRADPPDRERPREADATGRERPRGGIEPAAPPDGNDARPHGAPPPRPQPEVELPKARDDFAAVLAELDAIATEGRAITNEEWVQLYKKGNDALIPLQMHLSWDVAQQAEELSTAQARLREKLFAVQPRAPGG